MINGHEEDESGYALSHDEIIARIQHYYDWLKTKKNKDDSYVESYERLFDEILFMEF